MTENPTIRFRAIEPEDLDLLYRIENDVKLWNVGATNVPYSRYVLHNYIANATGDIYTDRQVRMMIENEDRQVVGMVDVVNFDPSNRRAELGLIIQEPFRKSGYGQNAVRLITDYATNILHLRQLYAVIDVQNMACIGLFRKMGYQPSAPLKDLAL